MASNIVVLGLVSNKLITFGFAAGGGIAPPVVTPRAVGGVGKKGTRRKLHVKVDDQLFEVESEEQALALLAQLRALAEETAAKVAAKAVKRLERAKTPAAEARAAVLPMPKVEVIDPGYADDFTHKLRAQVDAVRAQIAEIYAAAMKAEKESAKIAKQDEDDLMQILAMDADEDEKTVSQFLKTLKKK